MAGFRSVRPPSAGTSHVIGALSPHTLAAFSHLKRTERIRLLAAPGFPPMLKGSKLDPDRLQDTPPAGARAVRCHSAKARLQTIFANLALPG